MDSDIPQPVNTEYEIELTLLALEMLTSVKDQRHQKSLSDRIDKLKIDPEKQGKPLIDKLKGYRSVRAVAQGYRIIYKVELEHRFSNQKPNPPAPFPGREGGAKLPSPCRRGVGGEVLSRLLNWCSRESCGFSGWSRTTERE